MQFAFSASTSYSYSYSSPSIFFFFFLLCSSYCRSQNQMVIAITFCLSWNDFFLIPLQWNHCTSFNLTPTMLLLHNCLIVLTDSLPFIQLHSIQSNKRTIINGYKISMIRFKLTVILTLTPHLTLIWSSFPKLETL